MGFHLWGTEEFFVVPPEVAEVYKGAAEKVLASNL